MTKNLGTLVNPRIVRKRGRDLVREGDNARIRRVIHEVTGRTSAYTIDHQDGSRSQLVTPGTIGVNFDTLGVSLNEMEKAQYERLRRQGHSKEMALFLMKPIR